MEFVGRETPSRRVRWALVAVVAVVLLASSLLVAPPARPPAGERPPVPVDKALHVVGYAVLASALAYATADADRPRWQRAAFVATATVAYGSAIELLQLLVPYRHASVADLVADAVGAAVVLPWYRWRTVGTGT